MSSLKFKTFAQSSNGSETAASSACVYLVLLNGLMGLFSGVVGFSLALFLHAKSQSPSLMAMLLFCQMAPKVYMGFLAGNVVDYLGKDAVLRVSVGGLLLLYTGLAVLWGPVHEASCWLGLLFVFQVLLGLLSAFYEVAFLASVPAFAGPSGTSFLYGSLELCASSSCFMAPLIGSFLYPFIPFNCFFAGAAVSALLLWIFLMRLSFPLSLKAQRLEPVRLAGAFVFIQARPFLRHLLLYFSGVNFLNGIAAGVVLPYILQLCGGQTPFLGVVNFWMSVGAMVGGVVSLKRLPIPPFALIVAGGLLSAVCGRVLFGFSTSLFEVALWAAVRAGLTPVANTANQVIWSRLTPPEKRGRVFGARRLIAQGSYPLGLLVGGFLYRLSQGFGWQDTGSFLAITGCVEILCSGLLWLRMKKEKRRG